MTRLLNANGAEGVEPQARYVKGEVADVEVKQRLGRALNAFVEPIRERCRNYARDHTLVGDILSEGSCKARSKAQKTMEDVQQALQLYRGAPGEVNGIWL